MEWFWPEGFYTILMIFVFAFSSFALRLPIAIAMVVASLSGLLTFSLISGEFLSAGEIIRHLVEGEFGYLDTVLVIAAAMVFMKVAENIGLIEALSAGIIRKFRAYPLLLSFSLMFLIMIPGMLTGSSIAGVLTTGALLAPVMMALGVSRVKTGAAIAMAALYGMIAPPISIPAMIIGAGVDIPYVGFALPLLLAILVPTVFATLIYVYPSLRKQQNNPELESYLDKMSKNALTLRLFLPAIVLLILLVGVRGFPNIFPSIGLPMVFLLAAAAGFLSGSKWKPLETVAAALREGLPVMGILMGVGMFIQVMTLTGVRGFIVVSTLSLPSVLLFVGIATIMPLFGAVSSFGSASVLGVPFLLALLGYDEIVVASGLALISSIGDLMPPTALSGLFAAQVVKEKNYFLVLKQCIPAALVTLGWGVFVINFANEISELLKYIGG